MNVKGSHYVIQGIEFMTGAAGIRVMSGSYGTFQNNIIHDVHEVTLTMNIDGNEYHHMNVLDNEMYEACGTGEGMYIGYSDSLSNFLLTFRCNNDGIFLVFGWFCRFIFLSNYHYFNSLLTSL